MRKPALLLLVIIYFFITRAFVRMYSADTDYSKGQELLGDRETSLAFNKASLAIEKNPIEPLYYEGRAKALILMSSHQDAEIVRNLKSLAFSDMQRAYDLNSKNLVTIRNLVPIYYFLAQKDITAPPSADNVDPLWVNEVQSFYEVNKNISPNDVGVYALFAKYEKRLNLTEEYKYSVSKVKELRPDLLDWYDAFR